MTPSQRLLRRIADELGLPIPPSTVIRRTRAGRWQRSCGAWSWFAWIPDTGQEVCGSCYSVGLLLRAPGLRLAHDVDADVPSVDPSVN